MKLKNLKKMTMLACFLALAISAAECKQKEGGDNSGIGLLALLIPGGGGGNTPPPGGGGGGTNPPTITSFFPSQGPAGTTVTINGTNFSSTATDNTVEFNGTAAVVTYAASTYMTVEVQAGTTSGTISVTVGGNTVTSTDAFTIRCSPCRIFVTTGVYNGNLGGLSGGDAKCMSDSGKPATGTYRAWLMDGTTIAPVFQAGIQYIRPDGTVIVNSAYASDRLQDTGFVDEPGRFSNPITATNVGSVWIGNVGSISHCQGLNSSSNLEFGGIAQDSSSTSCKKPGYWCGNAYDSCDKTFKLYCVEQ